MLFSIAIPAYKSIFLTECIESVLNQTVKDFELIIVNDCSPEPIDEIVRLFGDERIRYFKNDKNIGGVNLVNNWNNCLEKANGDYFIMMGDDDTMEPDYLYEFSKLIEKYPHLDVYHCRSKIIDENSKPIGLTPSWPEYESVYESIWHRLIGKRLQFVSDFVYKTKTLRENGGFYFLPLAWAADDITAYIATGNKGIAHINKPVFNYRKNSLSISSTGNHQQKIEALVLALKWYNSFFVKTPDNSNDRILLAELKNKVVRQIQYHKEEIITQALRKNRFNNLCFFYLKRKHNGIPVTGFIKSLLRSYKTKI